MISYLAKKINNKYVKALQNDIRKQLEEDKEQERVKLQLESKPSSPIHQWSSGVWQDGSLKIPSPICGSITVPSTYGYMYKSGYSGATGVSGCAGTSGPGYQHINNSTSYFEYLQNNLNNNVDYSKYLSDKLDNSWMNQYAEQHAEPKRIVSLEDPYGEEIWGE